MGRKPDPQRKEALLDAVGAYLVDHGLGSLSLRPLASHLGVSTYTLVYHFQTKENLVYEVVRHLDRRQWSMIEQWSRDGLGLPDLLDRFWDWFAAPANRAVVALFHEATLVRLGTDAQGRGYAAELVRGWDDLVRRALVAHGLPARQAATEAAIVCATMTGLQIDLIASDDRRRTTAAEREYTRRLRAELPRAVSGRSTTEKAPA